MLRVGIVAEGPSDWLVLEAVMRLVQPDIEFVRLRPDQTPESHVGRGWKGVRTWCIQNGHQLELIMTGVVNKPLDLLVIHADCSMADKVGAEHPCPPAYDTAEALHRVIEQDWLSRSPCPEFVVIAAPSKSSDAWVAATFDPPFANLMGIECDHAVEDDFVKRKMLKRKDGQVKKQARLYEPLAARIGEAPHLVFAHCTQAEAFRSRFHDATIRITPPTP